MDFLTLCIVFGANYLIALPVMVFGAYLWFKPAEARMRLIATAALALPIAYLLVRLAGLLYAHPQPFAVYEFDPVVPHDIDNSFPSDHVAIAGVFATVVFLHHRLLGLGLWVATALIALARMSAGLHWSSDVFAAAAIAALAVFASQNSIRTLKL
ncbi:MAG: phosphatase PAP2 family protein [Patescibacteria group bacterium]